MLVGREQKSRSAEEREMRSGMDRRLSGLLELLLDPKVLPMGVYLFLARSGMRLRSVAIDLATFAVIVGHL